jgi:hypothetical protein
MANKFYESVRKQEARDAGMISEDKGAIANLPQGVIMKEYPKVHSYLPENLDDTIKGIDRQITFDNSKKMANFDPKKI